MRQLDVVPPQNFLELCLRTRLQIGEQNALMRRQPNARPQRAAHFAQRRFQLQMIVVEDAAIFDIQSVKQPAIALFVPAQVIVEAPDIFRIGRPSGLP